MTTRPDDPSESVTPPRQVLGIKRGLESNGSPPTQHPGRILLVDDDPKFRQILQSFLELKGFRVITAGSGEDALDQLTHCDPRVVLLDMKMPGMDGLLTLKHLRISHPNLPVIFVTQMDEEERINEAGVLGVNDYLIKPFSFEALEAILLTKVFSKT